MDDRYKVAIGYPQEGNPSGMSALRLRAHLTTEHFRTWCELMQTLASVDGRMHEESVRKCTGSIPPTGNILILFDVLVMQCVSDGMPSGPPWVRMTAKLSYSSIKAMIEYMLHWNAVEDELEAEQEGSHP